MRSQRPDPPGEILRGVLLLLDQDQPVTRVVAHDRLDAIRAVGRLLQEGHALGAEFLVGLAAVVDSQSQATHLALLQLTAHEQILRALDATSGEIAHGCLAVGRLEATYEVELGHASDTSDLVEVQVRLVLPIHVVVGSAQVAKQLDRDWPLRRLGHDCQRRRSGRGPAIGP
jgi:hypothetical protein